MDWRPRTWDDAYWVFLEFRLTTFFCAVPHIVAYRARDRLLKHRDEQAWIYQRLKRVVTADIPKNGNGHTNGNGRGSVRELKVTELTRRRLDALSDQDNLCHSITNAPNPYPVTRPDDY